MLHIGHQRAQGWLQHGEWTVDEPLMTYFAEPRKRNQVPLSESILSRYMVISSREGPFY